LGTFQSLESYISRVSQDFAVTANITEFTVKATLLTDDSLQHGSRGCEYMFIEKRTNRNSKETC